MTTKGLSEPTRGRCQGAVGTAVERLPELWDAIEPPSPCRNCAWLMGRDLDVNRRPYMTRPEILVVKFLQMKLARGPVGVSDLEAVARTARLLGEGQRITDAKLFKRAKKSLGIRSVRSGFASAGEWFWLLDKQPAPLVAEPPSVVAPPIPSSWIAGVARLDYHRSPTDIPPHRWRQFLADCNNFLASGANGAERAVELGWDGLTLFGCRRHRPLEHLGGVGLVWVINGGRLVELHRDWAVFELSANGSQRIFDRRRVDAANVRLPWADTEVA
jgi:hypothetical protein